MCSLTAVFGAMLLSLQVPSPTAGEDVSKALRAFHSTIVEGEQASIQALVDRLTKERNELGAQQASTLIAAPVLPNGPTRVLPLPEVVVPRTGNARDGWHLELDAIREQAGNRLFGLAKQASETRPPHYALAILCLRELLERIPDHAEARRLMGYVPYKGGWARPFAVAQFEAGKVSHPIFGWVKADWVAHLEQGELPAPSRGIGKVRWLNEADADQLRAGWNPPWHIFTEHFEIQTSVTLAETISFGRRLEAFHDLFFTVMADVLGQNLPLARRFRDPKLVGEPNNKRHVVYYFGSKEDYIAYFNNRVDRPDLDKSLGYYEPPKPASNGRGTAYFFRDPNPQLPVTATLYHEVSHQLLFENAGPNAYTKNVGNYWVFEGLGTYFETVQSRPDGSLEVGGLIGRRMEEAIKAIVLQAAHVPLAYFVQYDQARFNHEPEIYLHYQQAMALTCFLMQYHDGEYRQPFLAYVREAYRGNIKRTTGRSLQDRLGVPYATVESQFLMYLREPVGLTRSPSPPASDREKSGIRSVAPIKAKN